jgi:hypothetical protein
MTGRSNGGWVGGCSFGRVERFDRPIARKVTPLGVAAAIAGPQHGVVARRQLLRAGLPRDAVDHLVAAGSLILLYRGVYAVGHRSVGPRSREIAVVLHAGPRGALGLHSAGGLWEMRRWRGVVHVIGSRPRRGPGFVIHRTRHLPPEDVTEHWGIPVTTPLGTLLDLSRHLSVDDLDAALAEALVRKLVTLEDLQPRATGNLRKLLPTAPPTRSRLERNLRRLLREHGLPQPISNGIVHGYEVDLHWPEHNLVAELDGYAYHAHRRGAFETDRLEWHLSRGMRDLGATRRSGERVGERDHLGDRRDRQGPVEVREVILDAQVVQHRLVDDEHDEVRHAGAVARHGPGELLPAREVDEPFDRQRIRSVRARSSCRRPRRRRTDVDDHAGAGS